MAMAVTFVMKRGQAKDMFFLPLQQVLDHLASTEGYALRHATGRDRQPASNVLVGEQELCKCHVPQATFRLNAPQLPAASGTISQQPFFKAEADPYVHGPYACDVLTTAGGACGSTNLDRSGHKGPTVPL